MIRGKLDFASMVLGSSNSRIQELERRFSAAGSGLARVREESEAKIAREDVFLCHASEDKEAVVRPLAEALRERSISYWLDEIEIGWGDSVVGGINDGLARTRVVLVVISKHFLRKKYAKRELSAAISRQGSRDDRTVITPLLVGSESEHDEILGKIPFVAEKMYLIWEGDPGKIAAQVAEKIAKLGNT